MREILSIREVSELERFLHVTGAYIRERCLY